MSATASSTNPNDGIGGGGCLCHPIKAADTNGPYIIFTATETDSNVSPHAVLCAGCPSLKVARRKLKTDLVSAGEGDPVAVRDDLAL